MQTDAFGVALGREGYLPWSYSKAEAAKTCLYKFAKIYIDEERENSPALLLGSFAHETMEALLRDKEAPTLDKAKQYLQNIYDVYDGEGDKDAAFNEVVKLLDYMVEFVTKWKNFISEKQLKHWRIESAYGLQENFNRAPYEPHAGYRTYIRGKIDLWAYDPKEEILYVLDHKTNKNADSPKKVKENMQLNLYITFLSNFYKLKWKKAYFGLNFLKRKKIVWATTTPEENKTFSQVYWNTLHFIEGDILKAELNGSFDPEETYKCGMCSFKNECPLQLEKQNLLVNSIT